MLTWHILLLAILQGLTEFLPVSSSGHLALLENLLGWANDELLLKAMLPFNAVLHFGTLLAIIAYFRGDMVAMLTLRHSQSPNERNIGNNTSNDAREAAKGWIAAILVANIPTGIIGICFERSGIAERATASMPTVGAMLVLTGILLLVSERIAGKGTVVELNLWRAILIGCAQGLAVLPGLSRSGATIAAGLISGLDRDVAARFAFLVSIPAVLGASLFELKDLPPNIHVDILHLLFGCFIAGVVGYVAIGIVMHAVRSGKLWYFALYCFAISIIAIAASLTR